LQLQKTQLATSKDTTCNFKRPKHNSLFYSDLELKKTYPALLTKDNEFQFNGFQNRIERWIEAGPGVSFLCVKYIILCG